ncbi:precorrin-6y C5,15-methyltransferase (decarboxylating) subunit CbiE [Rhizosaccharibacter radicis]|uniref:Precorrin-6y C5,15-methyltransferase (Decarboxylating) subunit CbiE n=1 Tax=Rhizosaccharibacter radicis TaxID=2782605 RepID=A0ABT1VY69_9PROT|nr:precorrin-6y C5,15-methyltransferase (decarboxylating) subunit CbiE [Acetobacteraceae bacterium KSS12]
MSDQPWLTLIGIGEDGLGGLSAAARELIGAASLVVGGRRHLALAAPLIGGEMLAWPSPMEAALPQLMAHRPRPAVVLASGDPFWFGVGTMLSSLVPEGGMRCLPAPSSFSLAAACLGWSLQDIAALSVCGRPVEALRPHLHPGGRLLVLCADRRSPAIVAALLCRHGFGASRLHLLEALGGPAERRRACRADGDIPDDIGRLVLLGIEVRADGSFMSLPLGGALPDDRFDHDGQITKQEIRAATLAALEPRPGALLWDIGAGSGSVGIEWMLRHPSCRAVAVERDPIRADRIARNALELGVPALEVRRGEAPEILASLPPPDAVFVGGGATVSGMMEAAWSALPRGGRLVANGVTVETEAVLLDAHRRFGGRLVRLSVDRLNRVGGLHAFRPSLPVTQWGACKP